CTVGASLRGRAPHTEHTGVRGCFGGLHDPRRSQIWNLGAPGARRQGGPPAGVDDDALAFELARAAPLQLHLDAHAAREVRLAEDQLDVRGLLEALLAPVAKPLDDRALAREDAPHVDLDRARLHAILRAP